MTHTQRKYLLYVIAALGTGGILFNLVQIIIIINGGYNRNPNIQPEWLQTLDAIGLTAIMLLISGAVVFGAIRLLRQQK